MEINVPVPELTKALQRVQGIAEKKPAMPALSHALIQTGDGQISVTASSLEVSVQAEYPAEVKLQGAVCISARPLYDMVRSLSGPSVLLKTVQNGRVRLSCGRTNYRVNSLAPEQFPSIQTAHENEFVSVSSSLLKEMVDKTLYAVSVDETRYNLNGVYMEASQEAPGLRMVATDGHRLSMVDRPLETPLGGLSGIILPRKGLNELRKLLDEGGEIAQLAWTETHLTVHVGGVRLTMQLVEGRFPDYKQVIPQGAAQRVVVDRQSLIQGLRRTSLLSADGRTQGVKLEVEPNRLQLSVNNPDFGDAQEEVEIGYEGKPITIGFNCRYLLEALNVIPHDEIYLSLTDDLAPGVVTTPGDEGFKAVVMPMRI